jgi:hypothetical protein
MKSKKIVASILVVIIVLIVIFAIQRSQKETLSPTVPTIPPTPSVPDKIQECPEAWYKNMMPIIVDDPQDAKHAGEYFIVNGQKREISEYDVEWIVDNCEVNQPQPIY